MTLQELLRKLDNVRKRAAGGYTARCPAHQDHHNSLAINELDGKLLLHCFRGCSLDSILDKLNVETSELFIDSALSEAVKAKPKRVGTKTWDIVGTDNVVIAQHTRHDYSDGSKSYIWSRNGAKGLNGYNVVNMPLYGLLWLEDNPDHDIILTEGEKAADSLHNRGYRALGTVCGSASCPSEESLMPLMGWESKLFLWPDNDHSGRNHMSQIAQRLSGMGLDPYIVNWREAPPKGDAADYDGDIESLLSDAAKWEPVISEGLLVLNDKIEQEIMLPFDNTLLLQAENIRKERTGVHAKISILLNGAPIAYDTFNITRDKERTSLGNSAAEHFPDNVKATYGKAAIKKDLGLFCSILWQKQIDQQMGKPLTGDETVIPPTFILNPYILRGGGTVMFAPPGMGKSYIAMLMAVSIHNGVSTLWNVKRTKVLFINLERSEESMRRRLALVNRSLGLASTSPMVFLNARGMALNDIVDAAKATIKQYGIEIVFLDSISRSGLGDLNENISGNRIIDAMSSMTATWFAIAHTPRADSDHAYGTVMLDAGADIMVKLSTEQQEGTLGVGLEIVKGNDVAKGQMKSYALEFTDAGLSSARIARPCEFSEINLTRKKSLSVEIKEYLLQVGEATATEIAEVIGRDRPTVSRLIINSELFIKTKREGKNTYYGVRQ
ncbi:MAG: hypothetical protein DRN07_08325 [Thermoplasmata archaeon]|nr:MAG: hypothetical protein DRN07_08325 [Thermoplasmata archaeon]